MKDAVLKFWVIFPPFISTVPFTVNVPLRVSVKFGVRLSVPPWLTVSIFTLALQSIVIVTPAGITTVSLADGAEAEIPQVFWLLQFPDDAALLGPYARQLPAEMSKQKIRTASAVVVALVICVIINLLVYQGISL
jgi:hypothetical protein